MNWTPAPKHSIRKKKASHTTTVVESENKKYRDENWCNKFILSVLFFWYLWPLWGPLQCCRSDGSAVWQNKGKEHCAGCFAVRSQWPLWWSIPIFMELFSPGMIVAPIGRALGLTECLIFGTLSWTVISHVFKFIVRPDHAEIIVYLSLQPNCTSVVKMMKETPKISYIHHYYQQWEKSVRIKEKEHRRTLLRH